MASQSRRFLCLLCSLLLLLLQPSLEVGEEEACAEEDGACVEQRGRVLELDDSNFSRIVEGSWLTVVAFHAPWCHHCHGYLDDVFRPAASQLAGEGVTMATVNIETAKDVQNKHVIREVPAVRLFRNGMMFPYQGPPQHMGVTGLVDYLRKEKAKPGLEENPVITLTNDNFDDVISSSELILVEFYTDMCVPCQQLESHFMSAARHLLRNDPPVLLGRVQIPDQIEVAKRFPLEGYPLLIMFRKGRQYNYTGPKDEEGIVEYMRRQAGPGSILLERAEDVRRFTRTREVTVVAYFNEHTESKLTEEFIESGNVVRTNMRLGHTLDVGVASSTGQSTDTIVVYHPTHLITEYEDGFSVLPCTPANATELGELYLEHSRPLVGEMTQLNYATSYRHRPLLLVYYDVDWSHDGIADTKYWHHLIASVAKDFLHSNIIFAVANEGDYPNDLRSLGLSDWGEDVAVGLFAPGPLKYPMTEELTWQSLTQFLQDYLAGQLQPHFSSEPPPKPTRGALIRKVVGSTFRSEVLSLERHVLVLLCLPSLPACQTAHRHLTQLAIQFKAVTHLRIAEMNLDLNDPPPGTPIGALPVFFFSLRGSEEMFEVTPTPQDEADLAFFLKWKQNIKPLEGSKVKEGGKRRKREGVEEGQGDRRESEEGEGKRGGREEL